MKPAGPQPHYPCYKLNHYPAVFWVYWKLQFFTKEPFLLSTYFNFNTTSCRKWFTELITNPWWHVHCSLISVPNVMKESRLPHLAFWSQPASQRNIFWLRIVLVRFQQINEVGKSVKLRLSVLSLTRTQEVQMLLINIWTIPMLL